MSQKGKLLILLVLLLVASCAPTSSPSKNSFAFTYSTYQGGIYQAMISGEKSPIIPADGIHRWFLRWSPDQTHLAYVTVEFMPDGRRDTLWVVNADGSDARPLFGPAKALLYSWEEDGQTIYIEEAISFERIPFDEDTVIRAYTIDVKTGVVQGTKRKTELFPPPRESPDGNRAIWADPTDDKWTLYLLDSQENKLSVIYQPPPGRMTNGIWSPDSQRLAIIRPEDREIYLYEMDTREWLKLSSLSATHRDYRISNVQWSPDGERLSYTLNDQDYLHQICVLRIEGQSEQCFNTQWISNAYVWSRDSRYIAYLSKTSSGEVDIFVVDIYEGVIKNLTQDGSGAIEERIARWSS